MISKNNHKSASTPNKKSRRAISHDFCNFFENIPASFSSTTGRTITVHHCKSPQWPQSIPENLRIEPSMLLEAINGGDRSCDRSCSMEAIAVAIAVAINGGRAQFLNGGDRIWKRSQLRSPVAGAANLRLSSDLSAVQHVLILSGLMGPMPSAVSLRSCEKAIIAIKNGSS